jgi:hypothetical protein
LTFYNSIGPPASIPITVGDNSEIEAADTGLPEPTKQELPKKRRAPSTCPTATKRRSEGKKKGSKKLPNGARTKNEGE